VDSQCLTGEECRRGICQINDNSPSTSSSSSGGTTSSSSSGGASSSGGGGGGATRPGSHKACTFDSQCLSNEECRRGICQVNF
jgi:hypothetical protein